MSLYSNRHRLTIDTIEYLTGIGSSSHEQYIRVGYLSLFARKTTKITENGQKPCIFQILSRISTKQKHLETYN